MKKLALLISTVSILAIASPAKALYNFTASTGGTVDSAGTFVTGSNADDSVFNVVVPFDFSIYGTPVTTGSNITVSTNGNIQFLASGGSPSLSNTTLPSNEFSNVPVIAAFWDDVDLRTIGGGIYTSTAGVVGSRIFDIEWRGETFVGSGSPSTRPVTANFEVRFFEGSNSFQIVYGQTGDASNAGRLNGLQATVGVQAGNTAGSPFTQYSFNQAVITPGLTLTATPVPFGFSPVSAIAFMGANLIRRRFQSAKSEKVTQ